LAAAAPVAPAADEARFGVLHEPIRIARGIDLADAQWTGVVTSIALSMLESKMVDAVVCIGASDRSGGGEENTGDERWCVPEPILARTKEDVLRGRGVKPSLAPSLAVLDEIHRTIRKLLFCGVGCDVQAFRAIQSDLNLDQVYVLGTNCADNSPTPQAAERFIRDGVQIPTSDDDLGYEFMQDFRVHVKTTRSYVTKPYFCLPGTIAEQSIAKSCLSCFDYTNGIADVVVGYMGAPLRGRSRMDQSDQTLTVRRRAHGPNGGR
jgi:coenzyme F420-reducing hydrogenase beta subunit